MRRAAAWLAALAVLAPATGSAANRIAASGRYVCDDGSAVVFTEAAYGTTMRRNGRTVQLSRQAAFSGFSYSGGGLSLHGEGVEGVKTLTIDGVAGGRLACQAVPATAAPGVAAGVVIARSPLGLPPGAVLTIEVRDTARADATAPLLGQARFRPRGHEAPLHWWLHYDAKRAAHPARPALSARITDPAGKLLWISDTFTPVPVGPLDSFADAEIWLVPVRR